MNFFGENCFKYAMGRDNDWNVAYDVSNDDEDGSLAERLDDDCVELRILQFQ